MTVQPRVPPQGTKASKLVTEKTYGVNVAEETLILTGEFVGETHRVLEDTQIHPSGNQHQKGPICLWVAEEVTESLPQAKQAALFPFGPLPHRWRHNAGIWVAPPWQILKAPPLTM